MVTDVEVVGHEDNGNGGDKENEEGFGAADTMPFAQGAGAVLELDV